MKRIVSWLAVMLIPAVVAAADLHQLWDRQCGGCHGHAGPFVRDRLQVVDGALHDRSGGRDVGLFLRTHNGGYPPEIIAALSDMMMAQATTPELFRARCGGCHDTAAQLVRDQVAERDGRLVGLGSGRPLDEFLPGHVSMAPEEKTLMMETLQRVYREVHHQP